MLKNSNNHFIKLSILTALSLFLISCEDSSQNVVTEQKIEAPKSTELSSQSISMNNTGVGEMGYFSYSKAADTFQELVNKNPNWVLAKQNLAIAMLNRQKPGDEELAMNMVKELSEKNDENLVAHYIVGILKFNQGLCDEALPRFNKILELDNTDAYAMYFAGQCELQNGSIDKALVLYEKAIETDNYLRSAYYGGFMAAQRLQKRELAKEMLDAYQKLDSNPKAKLAEIKYTRMGPKAIAQAYTLESNTENKEMKVPQSPFFAAPKAIEIDTTDLKSFGIVDLKQDGVSQLYIAASGVLKLYDNFLGTAKELEELTISLNQGNNLLAWGDINNDNKLDLYVTGTPDQLYLQNDSGLSPVDMQSFGFGQLSSSAVRVADADHDGDLDVFVLDEDGQFELWNNNLNNTFTALSENTKLIDNKNFKSIYIHDLDSDRDADIVLISDNQISILLNDRMWDYQFIQSEPLAEKILSVSLADNDINGKPEINILTQSNRIDVFQLLENKISKNYSIGNAIGTNHVSIDVNGNGHFEHLMTAAQGINILSHEGSKTDQIAIEGLQSMKVMHTMNGPELLYSDNQKLYHVAASSNRLPFTLYNFSGKEDDANSVRSNFSGIGTRIVSHSENFYAIGDSFQNLTGIDQDFQAISLAAGKNKTNDFLAIEWSDGVFQTELGLEAGQHHKITETQRQLSSCPVIFTWNNGQYEFVSDVLGVGGIGFAIGRHEYGVPRPWENYLLTSDQLSSVNGEFKFQFTEPMEESAYLDEMQLQVIDVPSQWSVILDERMQISEPIVTGEPLFYEKMIQPIQVLSKHNNDVTVEASATDKKAIDIINQDNRFLGLVEEQVITMEFNDGLIGDYHLIMNGWVEYGYSQTMFAAWQAGLYAQAPTIEYKVKGQWKTLLTEFGYPAGMPRSASVPINLPEKTRFLRLRTNMEIYFDQLALIQTGQPTSIQKYNLELTHANLQQVGFPKRQDNHQRVPSYDFNDIEPFWDTRYMEGAYTQLGDVTELIQEEDNALAIIGAGEGIEIKFNDDLPRLEEGYDRYFIMKFKGWAKDMDILTKGGETLSPIPSIGPITNNAKSLNLRYNTRFKAGK
ncbi:MAG: FG-GAP-like repeat-containing protein [Marinicellaceae bacterium]